MHYRWGSEPGQNSVNLKTAAYYSISMHYRWESEPGQNSVNLNATTYYNIICNADGGLSQAHSSVNPKS